MPIKHTIFFVPARAGAFRILDTLFREVILGSQISKRKKGEIKKMRMMILGNIENLLYFLTCLSVWIFLFTLRKGKTKEEKEQEELKHIFEWMDDENERRGQIK